VFLPNFQVSSPLPEGVSSVDPSRADLNGRQGGPPATGNMKRLLNGRSTIGTLDGAQCGKTAIWWATKFLPVFANTPKRSRRSRNGLPPRCLAETTRFRPRAIDLIGLGHFSEGDRRPSSIRCGQTSCSSDPFRVMADIGGLLAAPEQVELGLVRSESWSKMSPC